MSKIPGSAHPSFGLGGMVILGGAVGYFRKGSKPSLGAGLLFGGLLIGSGLMITGDQQFEGHTLAAGVSGLMTLAMGQRFLSTGKFMPAGLVASVGALSAAYHTKKALEWR
jgi:uncharacterized membrane protein (UPF0136 family)